MYAVLHQEVCLPGCGDDADRFCKAAVSFANEKCWGTLSCCMFIDPHTQQRFTSVVDNAVEGLKYGSIVVNAPAFLGFAIPSLAWGAYPGECISNSSSDWNFALRYLLSL